jgi:hypothetical protein
MSILSGVVTAMTFCSTFSSLRGDFSGDKSVADILVSEERKIKVMPSSSYV